MDSGIAPLLLEKTQLGFAGNLTVRDGFATCRPPYTKQLTINYPSDEVQEAIEQGLFQGAMMTPYQPDNGYPEQIAQIAGRLFRFQITPDEINVSEITISGDPNPATSTQAWIWQSENFVIIQDGISLPIFYDGSTTRRSYGPSQLLATQDAGPVAKPTAIYPEVGSTALLTLTGAYTGPYNVPVIIDSEYYQPIENSAGYLVNAEALFDVPGTPIPIGTAVTAKPVIGGVLSVGIAPVGTFFNNISTQVLTLTAPYSGAFLSYVELFGKTWQVIDITGNNISVIAKAQGTYSTLPAGTQISILGSTAPNLVYGTETIGTVAPAIGGTIQLTLNSAYTGADGQIVYIGTYGQYKLTAVPPVPGSTTLTVLNLSNTTAGNFANAEIFSVPELPAGRMGAYGLGQNWVALVDGTSFVPSDIVGGPSGTPAYQYRDAVLKTTIVDFRAGSFRIPVAGDTITSMSFPAVLDTSLGQGALQIGTQRSFFSCRAPIDLTILTSLDGSSPILTESLKGRGPLAQNSTINVNSDTLFRSTVGLGSLILGRREFTQSISGNTPISEEMVRVFNQDDEQLLPYSSAINFDNRVIYTASPQSSSQGVFHSGLVVMNLDSISSLRGKEPPVYDGLWTGINVLQLFSGLVNGAARAFAFTFNVSLSKIEIYELLPTGSQFFDNGSVPITWQFETASLFGDEVKPKDVQVQLLNGEFAVDEVRGTVRFEVFYKPDQYGAYGESSCWIPWHAFSVCAATGSKPLYFPRLGLGEPSSDDCVGFLKVPARNAYNFQVRFVITGMCRFLRARFAAVTLPIPTFQPPICDETETVTV